MTFNLNNIINLRGYREQSFCFAIGKKGGMKQCFTRGCEIFVPLQFALNNIDIQNEIRYEQAKSGETQFNEEVKFIFNQNQ